MIITELEASQLETQSSTSVQNLDPSWLIVKKTLIAILAITSIVDLFIFLPNAHIFGKSVNSNHAAKIVQCGQ